MSKKLKITLIVVTLLLIISASFVSGCFIGIGGSRPNLSLINQAWNVIYQNYVDPSKLDPTTQNEAAVKGILGSVNDPYSVYLNPQDYQLYQNDVQGKFEGIGATVQLNAQKQPSVVSTVPGSPAEAAGIKAGDIILAVDGKSTSGMSLTAVVQEVQGPAGSQVTLTIMHAGETTTVDISITRAQINQTSVNWQMKGTIAYIQITEFNETTNADLNTALTSMDLTTTTGIILDLRNNPGGLVTTVIDVASHFIKDGVIITLVDNKGNKTTDSVNPNGVFTELPMVVLVNENSASGAEVLTGALHDHNRATIAGVKTFGKGSYDSAYTLSDGSAIYLTIGRWLTPNGNAIEGVGITPDDVLTQTGDAEIQWAIDFLSGAPVGLSVNVAAGQPFNLYVGQSAVIGSLNISIKFLQVSADSRCPSDVKCVQAGSVSCLVEVTAGGQTEQLTMVQPPGSQTYQGRNFTFDVKPYPVSTVSLGPNDYYMVMTVN